MSDKTFEDRIMDAVVLQFFSPQVLMTPVFNPNSGMTEVQTHYGESPAARVARDIWTAKHAEIVEAVKDRLSVEDIADALAARVTADVVDRMTKTGMWTNYDADREKMRQMVNERIADELARRALEKMDAEPSSGAMSL